MFRWEWVMVRVALEMVPTSVDMLSIDIQQGTTGHTRDGVPERLSSCSRCGVSSNAQVTKEGAC